MERKDEMTGAATTAWGDDAPIYRQIMDRVLAGILDGTYPEGDYLPSVRQFATLFEVNSLTVAKALGVLTQLGVTEKRRGLGLMLKAGAREEIMAKERRKFLEDEWPELRLRLQRMGITAEDLLREG